MSAEREHLIDLLWSDYLDLIAQNLPVYFTFTHEGVDELIIGTEFEEQGATAAINAHVRDLLHIFHDEVMLKPGALDRMLTFRTLEEISRLHCQNSQQTRLNILNSRRYGGS